MCKLLLPVYVLITYVGTFWRINEAVVILQVACTFGGFFF
jgi:hypothetical protein